MKVSFEFHYLIHLIISELRMLTQPLATVYTCGAEAACVLAIIATEPGTIRNFVYCGNSVITVPISKAVAYGAPGIDMDGCEVSGYRCW